MHEPPTATVTEPPRDRDEPVSARGRTLPVLVAVALVCALLGGVAGGVIVSATTDDGAATSATSPTTAAAADRATTPASSAAGSASSVHDLVVEAEPSIVAIHTEVTQTDFFGRQVTGQAAGTGFVLTADGYLVTNNHVIEQASDITVDLADGSHKTAKLVAADPDADLAVLKIDASGLRPLPLGDSDALQVGDQVVAIGNALDLGAEPTVTSGIVSATNRTLVEPNGVHLAHLIQTDTAINPGNSGGPLLDASGSVVGINTAIAGQSQNIGFAIAINPAKALIDQLQSGQVPDHALLGVATRQFLDDSGGPAGSEVMQVQPGSAADAAGIQVGDVITAVGDTAVSTPDELGAAIAGHRPGDQVAVTVRRNGNEHKVQVTLGSKGTVGA